MKITYLNHSGFLLEGDTCYCLFDYYKGNIPTLDSGKDIFVFCSHSHEDHFNPDIFQLKHQYPKVTYVFSNEVRKTCKRRLRDETELFSQILFLKSRDDYEIAGVGGTKLKIHTLLSTDRGCAFIIEYEGCVIYHAGDLNNWVWEEESEEWNHRMRQNFRKEMQYLEGQTLDIAFVPLDPRQGKDYFLGMKELLEKTTVKHLFPMHFWNDFSVIEKYIWEYELPEQTHIYKIKYDGETWDIPWERGKKDEI